MGWAVVISQPQAECKAIRNAERQGFECYFPQLKITRIRRHRKVEDVQPLFPRYFFVRAIGEWRRLLGTIGVSNVVRYGDRIAVVSDAILLGVRQQSGPDGFFRFHTESRVYRQNQVIQINGGPFAGKFGVYKGMAPHDRALVLIQWLGAQRLVQVEEGSLTPA